jgi:calcium permeable stress-gated cation channel
VSAALRFTDDEVFETYGIDVLTYLQFIKFCFSVFALMAIVGLLVLLPTNLSGDYQYTGLNATTMANIDQDDNRHWIHLLATYTFTGGIVFLAYYYFGEYLRRMHEYRKLPLACNYTIMVKGIPPEITTAQQLYDQFDKFYPSQVVSAHLIYNTEKLDQMIRQMYDYRVELEAAETELRATRIRPTHKIYKLGEVSLPNALVGDEVDSIDFFRSHLKLLEDTIPEEQKKITEESSAGDYPPTDAGFITFKTLIAANQCAQTEYTSASVSYWRVKFAPAPSDINWETLKVGLVNSLSRTALVSILVAMLIVFWAAPVTAIASLSNLHSVKAVWAQPFVDWVYAQPEWISATFTRLVPSALLVLIMLLPVHLFRLFVTQERQDTSSAAELSSFRKYYLFVLFNVLLLSTLTSQITTIVGTLLDNPTGVAIDLARTMGQTLPNFGGFFINYMVNSTFLGGALGLTRIVWFCWHWVQLRFAKGHMERARVKKRAGDRFNYDSQYALHLNVFTIALAYSSLEPLILPVAACYFAIWFVIDKYNMMYVHYEHWDATGLWGAVAYRRVLAALVIYHFAMFGIFLVKSAVWEAMLMFPLFVVDFIVIYYGNRIYDRQARFLPLDQAAEVKATSITLGLQNKYRQPSLKPIRELLPTVFFRHSSSEEDELVDDETGTGTTVGVASPIIPIVQSKNAKLRKFRRKLRRRESFDSNPPEVPESLEELYAMEQRDETQIQLDERGSSSSSSSTRVATPVAKPKLPAALSQPLKSKVELGPDEVALEDVL